MVTTIGFVTQVAGVVRAIATDGSVRILALGDPLYANETLESIGNGSGATILFEDGRQVMMANNEQITLDETVYRGEGYSESEVALIQETLMNEGALEEAAAGEEAPVSDGGSNDYFVAERTGELGDVQSYLLGVDGLSSEGGGDESQTDGEPNYTPTVFDVSILDNEVLEGQNILSAQLTLTDANPNDTHEFFLVEDSLSISSPDGVVVDRFELVFNPDGSFDFIGDFSALASGEESVVTFSYYVVDNFGAASTPATVTLTIAGTNDQPAVEDVSVTQDEAIVGVNTFEGTLPDAQDDDANDSHVYNLLDGSIQVSSELVTGISVVLNPDGTYSVQGDFTALAAGESATVTFQYVADDGQGFDGTDGVNESSISEPATVTLTVIGTNDGPTALPDTATTNEDNAVTVDVLANDSDPDSTDTLTLQSVTVTQGTGVAQIVNNQLLYTPGEEYDSLAVGESATAIVTYVVNDGNGGTATSTATITIVGTNDQPEVANVSTAQNEAMDGLNTFTGALLANDVDASDTHTYHLVDESLHVNSGLVQNLTLGLDSETGQYTLTGDFNALAVGESATVTFQYVADDGQGFDGTDGVNESSISEPATVTLTIIGTNDQPVISDVNANESSSSWMISGGENEEQDYPDNPDNPDFPSGPPVGPVSQSNVSLAALNAFISSAEGSTTIEEHFTQADGYNPHDGSALKITLGASAGETVTFDWTFFDAEDSTHYNDFSFVVINGQILYPLANAAQSGYQNSGTFSYTFDEDGPHEIVFGVMNDEDGVASSSLQVTHISGGDILGTENAGNVEALGANMGIVYESSDPQSGLEDVMTTFTGGLATVQDDDANDTHTYEIVEESLHVDNELVTNVNVIVNPDGTYSVEGNFNALAAGESATVTFQYVADDGRGFDGTDGINESSISEPATVTLTITGTNDRPVVSDVSDSQNEVLDGLNTFSGTLVAQDDDANDTHTYEIVEESLHVDNELVTNVNVIVNPDGTYSVEGNFNALAAGESATVTFQYVADDGRGFDGTDGINESSISEPATVTLTITGTNDRPVVSDVDANGEGVGGGISGTEFSETHEITASGEGTIGYSYFTVTEETVVTITTNGPTIDPVLYLLRDDGALSSDDYITHNDDDYTPAGSFNNAIITVTLQPGNYVAAVSDYQLTLGEVIAGVNDTSSLGTYTGPVTLNFTTSSPVEFGGANMGIAYESSDPQSGLEDVMTTFTGGLATAQDDDANDTHTYEMVEESLHVDNELVTNVNVIVNPDGTYSVEGNFNALAAGESATVTFQYVADDGRGFDGTDGINESSISEPATVTLTITGTNDRPVVSDVSDSQNEVLDGLNTFSGTLVAQDDDANDTHEFFGVVGDDEETIAYEVETPDGVEIDDISINIDTQTGEYSVEGDFNALAAGEIATVTFQYYAIDSSTTQANGESNTSELATVTLTITGTNDAPIFSSEVVAGDILEGDSMDMLTSSGVINFVDVDLNDTHTVSVSNASQDALGSLNAVISEGNDGDGEGSVTWTYSVDDSLIQYLSEGQTKVETFDITIDDGEGGTDTQTITITITGTNDQPVLSAAHGSAHEDAGGTTAFGMNPNLLSFVYDVDDNDTHTISAVYDAASGTWVSDWQSDPLGLVQYVEITTESGATVHVTQQGNYAYQTNNQFEYLRDGAQGLDTFQFKVTDDSGASNAQSEAQTVTITINGANDRPIAYNVSLAISEATLEDVGQNPNARFEGAFSFADVDVGDTHSINLHQIKVGGPWWNPQYDDMKITGDGASIISSDETQINLLPNGNFEIINPAFNSLAEGQSVEIAFRYSVTDDSGRINDTSSIKTVTMVITGTNDAPVAVAHENFDAIEDAAVISGQLVATDVDSDDDSSTLTYSLVGDAPAGFVLQPDGSYTFDPTNEAYQSLTQGETTEVSFTWIATDSHGATTEAQEVVITVTGTNDAPVAVADVNSVEEAESGIDTRTGITGNVIAGDSQGNGTDSDVDNPMSDLSIIKLISENTGQELTAPNYSWQGDGFHFVGEYGNIMMWPDGSYLYNLYNDRESTNTLAEGEQVEEVFTYTISDGYGGESTATLTITITGTNDAPVAVAHENFDAIEDAAVISGQLVATDVDSDDDSSTLTYSLVGDAPAGFVLQPDGSYTFDPTNEAYQSLAQGETTEVSFTWIATDSHGATTEAQEVVITVTGTNDAPVAANDAITINEDTPYIGTLPVATDAEGDGVTYSVETEPGHGTVIIEEDGSYTYTPAQDYNGSDSFTYSVDDGNGGTNTYTVDITINPVNDAPVAIDDGHLGENLIVNGSFEQVTVQSTATWGVNASAVEGWDFSGNETMEVVNDGYGGVSATGDRMLDMDASPGNMTISQTISGLEDGQSYQLSFDTAQMSGDHDAQLEVYWNGSLIATIDPDGNTTVSHTIVVQGVAGDNTLTFVETGVADNSGTFLDNVQLREINAQFITDEDTPITFTNSDIVDPNDFDVDGDALTIVGVANPTNGTVALENGVVTFTPDANYSGPATFEYTISDGNGGTSSATVTLYVNPANDTPTIEVTAEPTFNEDDAAVGMSVATFVAADEEDGTPDVDFTTGTNTEGYYAIDDTNVVLTQAGVDAINAGETLPEISLTATDSDGATASDTATPDYTAQNDTPTIEVTAEPTFNENDATVGMSVATFVAADEEDGTPDVDFTTGTNTEGYYAIDDTNVVLTQAGVDAINAGETLPEISLTATDDGGLTATDSATPDYTAQNDTPTIEVTAEPTFNEDDAAVGMSVATFVAADEEDGTPSVDFTTGTNTEGYYAIDDTNVVLTQAGVDAINAGETLPEISLTATDSDGATASDTATPDYTAQNDDPIAVNDTYSNGGVDGLVGEYFVYNEGPDGSNLTSLSMVNNFIDGANPDATFVATSISYGEINGNLGSDGTLQTFLGGDAASLNTDPANSSDAIIKLSGSVSLEADTTYYFRITSDDGFSLTIDGQLVSEFTSNRAPGESTGEFTTQNAGEYDLGIVYWDQGGQAALKVEVSTDGVNYEVLSTSNIIQSNDASLITDEDISLVIDPSTLLANDSDPDGDDISITGVDNATNGTATLNSDGTITFTPDANYSGEATFKYTISDGNGGEDTAIVTLYVNPIADEPVLIMSVNQDTQEGVNVAESDALTQTVYEETGNELRDSDTLEDFTDGLSGGTSEETTQPYPTGGNGPDNIEEHSAEVTKGLIYLEAGTTLVFTGYCDDSFLVELGGHTLISTTGDAYGNYDTSNTSTTNIGGGTYTGTGEFTASVTGYYTFETYIYNHSGPGDLSINVSVDGAESVALNTDNFGLYTDISEVGDQGMPYDAFVQTDGSDGGVYPISSHIYTYEFKINATLTDDSETLSPVTILVSSLGGGTLSGAGVELNGDGTYYTIAVASGVDTIVTLETDHALSVDEINTITGSVTSTESNDLQATVTETALNEIVGTDGDDILEGTEGDDLIIGGDGDDIINGNGGDDTIDGGDGNDASIIGDDNIDLSNVSNIETLELGDNSEPLALSVSDVLDITGGGSELTITGEGTVQISVDDVADNDVWTKNDGESNATQSVYEAVYNGSDIKLIIDQGVDTDIV